MHYYLHINTSMHCYLYIFTTRGCIYSTCILTALVSVPPVSGVSSVQGPYVNVPVQIKAIESKYPLFVVPRLPLAPLCGTPPRPRDPGGRGRGRGRSYCRVFVHIENIEITLPPRHCTLHPGPSANYIQEKTWLE